ncbi:MAG TPA: HTTM domain-containing protein, partial [Anaerolineae bacterium]|nr:HTTM domain-containing protein [Anaerolineae bacterium]
FIVYFYGGIAKLNADWLMGEPMRLWLAERAHYPVLGPFFATEWAVYFFGYGGLLFDLSIGFLLLWPPARLLAFLGLLFFHLMNNWLFSIGVFPFLALASTILFVEPDWPRRMLLKMKRELQKRLAFLASPDLHAGDPTPSPVTSSHLWRLGPWTFGFMVLYLALQLLIPLRHWLYPGNVSWTEEGHRFSWHMKLRDKEPRLEIKIIDPKTGQVWNANLKEDLTAYQITRMAAQPDMILQYAHHLKEKLQQTGLDQPIIIANAWASLNGRPFQRLIDPTVNLAQVELDLFAPATTWIWPLEEKLPHPIEPVLYLLVIVAMILANLGLALSFYLALGYSRVIETAFSPKAYHFDEGRAAAPALALAQVQVSSLIKVLASLLSYLAILLSLAAWVITTQPIYLGLALAAALLAAGWGLYLAPVLSSRFDRSYLCWGTTFTGFLSSLFLFMLIIVAAQS